MRTIHLYSASLTISLPIHNNVEQSSGEKLDKINVFLISFNVFWLTAKSLANLPENYLLLFAERGKNSFPFSKILWAGENTTQLRLLISDVPLGIWEESWQFMGLVGSYNMVWEPPVLSGTLVAGPWADNENKMKIKAKDQMFLSFFTEEASSLGRPLASSAVEKATIEISGGGGNQ